MRIMRETKPIRKLLVANRGEIALRVMRTARAMGISTVAVHGRDDEDALHVALADEAVRIGDEHDGIPYLNGPAILTAARRTGADALHPGYGFLAENAGFAQSVLDEGLVWVGPEPHVMRAMADKDDARSRASALGIPVVPGVEGRGIADGALVAAADKIGFPLLIKAVAGGGGRGMRVAHDAEALAAMLQTARQEAEQAFGDGRLLLERYVERSRHVEVQIFGDAHGHHVHLGERECSIQRRHQKLVEETPSPGIGQHTRQTLCSEAVRLVHALDYVGAGTVEFLVDLETQAHYFLEVNARIQVEHPVTEAVTGLDLVAWQLLVAEGRPLPLAQEAIRHEGHAIEVRLCAEDPRAHHRPHAGAVLCWRPPAGVRVEAALRPVDRVSAHYDSMIAKLVAHASDRAQAIRALRKALADTVLLGPPSNRDLLAVVLDHEAFGRGETPTRFLDLHALALPPARPGPLDLAAAALWRHAGALEHRFRNNPHRGDVTLLRADETTFSVALEARDGGNWAYGVGIFDDPLLQRPPALAHTLRLVARRDHDLVLEDAGLRVAYVLASDGDEIRVQRAGGPQMALREETLLPEPQRASGATGSVVAPSAATVTAIHVQPGEIVAEDAPLVTLEAMKMLTVLRAPEAGQVEAILCEIGQAVAAGTALVALAGEVVDKAG